jgi:ubiquinone/menaquinone biosynthesis C-methylase UbiE
LGVAKRIPDLGAAGGYFAVKFSRAVGDRGRVLAIDLDGTALSYMGAYFQREGVTNAELVQAKADDPGLPPASVDLIFLRDVYHHIERPETYFRHLAAALKPGGRVAIIDYRPDAGLFRRLFGHHSDPDAIVRQMRDAGYDKLTQFDFLPSQSFLIFASDRRQFERPTGLPKPG